MRPIVSADARRPAGRWFLAWILVGAGYAFALLSLLSIGIFVLPIVVGLTVLVARRPGPRAGMPGLVSGLGLPLLYVAYLNRDGPGTVCRLTDGGESCTDEWSPWPWLAIGLAIFAIGAVTFVRSRASRSG